MPAPLISSEKWIALQKRLKALGIQDKDLNEKFISGQGKGGQKINKSQHCVQLTFLQANITITCQAYRERERNRYRARVQLCERLEQKQRTSHLSKREEKIKKQKARRQRRHQDKKSIIDDKINWFPGHMAKTLTQLKEQLKRVDFVIELRDARLPKSSQNQDLLELVQHKERMVVLSKADLADPEYNKKWVQHIEKTEKVKALCLNLKNHKDIKELEKYCYLLQKKKAAQKKHVLAYTTLQILVLGIPNVGKSQLINQWKKKKQNQVRNQPGVTKSLQWIPIGSDILVMDSPGLLWPNLENQDQAMRLAWVAAIKEDILPQEKLCHALIHFLKEHYPQRLKNEFKVNDTTKNTNELLLHYCKQRNFYLENQEPHLKKTYKELLHRFHTGKFGRISIDQNC